MFLLSGQQFEREAAQNGRPVIACLAGAGNCGSVVNVVAARDERAGTICLYRYPSPFGRRGFQIGPLPFFLPENPGNTLYKQGFAESSRKGEPLLREPKIVPNVLSARYPEQRGPEQCTRGNGLWALRPVRALRPAATRLANRCFWALAPVRLVQPSPMAASAQPRLSGLRPTSPIATNIRPAATKRGVLACGPDLNRKPIAAFGRGGFFIAIAGGTGLQPRPEGTRNVQ